MKIVTAKEMQEIDRKTVEDYGILSLILMERAGLAVAGKVRELYPDKKVLVLCGSGNNGGDGLVAARELYNTGFDVRVFLTVSPKELKEEAQAQYRSVLKFGVEVYPMSKLLTHHSSLITHHCLLIDAVFGTGLSRPVNGPLAEMISFVNKSGSPVISIDIPSGISSDTGEALGQAISANYTVTFGLPKRGHLLYPGADHTGTLFVEEIGFPQELLVSEKLKLDLIDSGLLSGLLPARRKSSHKGDSGHVLIIAGSKGKTGAAFMAAKSCFRSGAGLVTIGVPESLIDVFQSRVTEEMILPLPDDGKGMLSAEAADEILGFAASKIDVIAIGPGIGVSEGTEKIMVQLIQKSAVPMVIDADGINSLKGNMKIFNKAKAPIVLTPHPGEMEKFLRAQSAGNKWDGSIYSQAQETERINRTVPFILKKDKIGTAWLFAKETGTYLVLKGAPTVIAEPEGHVFLNNTGNPGMATGGSGDVLTGIISSFLAQGLSPLESATLGVYIHGVAGDLAAHEKGEYSLIATDITEFLPAAFSQIKSV